MFNFILSKIQTRFNLLPKTTLKDKNQSILIAYCIYIIQRIKYTQINIEIIVKWIHSLSYLEAKKTVDVQMFLSLSLVDNRSVYFGLFERPSPSV